MRTRIRPHKHRMRMILIVLAMIPVLFTGQANATTQAGNLLPSGDFESGGLTGWITCGGVRLVDVNAGAKANEVHQGRYAMRLGYPTDGSCGGALSRQLQATFGGIQVPTDASNLTLSFWYSRIGAFGENTFSWHLHMNLNSTDAGEYLSLGGSIQVDVAAGWNQARWELSPADAIKARGRTFELSLYFDGGLRAEDELVYFIDDVQVLPAIVRTTLTINLPAALRGDTTHALVALGDVNGANHVVRANLDGSGITSIYQASSGSLGIPRWSSNGTKVAVPVYTLQRETNDRPTTTWAQISTVNTLDVNGSNAREIYRTTGVQQLPGVPPGCRAPRTDCTAYETPAVDQQIGVLDWSPDSKRIAINPCSWQRFADGYRTDPLCRVDVLDATTGISTPVLNAGTGASWGRNNQLLHIYNGGLLSPDKGIYTANMATLPTTYTLVFAHKNPIYGCEDVGATWSPDARHFVTMRFLPGKHYDAGGTARYNTALMLFDTQDIHDPRQLVLVDFGQNISTPRWSPDGRFILYTVQVSSTAVEQYWLDVTTSATGLLSKDIAYADWRPNLTQNPALQPRNYLPLIRR